MLNAYADCNADCNVTNTKCNYVLAIPSRSISSAVNGELCDSVAHIQLLY